MLLTHAKGQTVFFTLQVIDEQMLINSFMTFDLIVVESALVGPFHPRPLYFKINTTVSFLLVLVCL